MTHSTADVMVQVDAALARLVVETRELIWDWDRRFDTAVGRVSAPEHLAVLALLDSCFAHRWDHQDLREAPDMAREIADAWGGLRPGQRLYTLDPVAQPLLFAAWWPWGSGKTFSVRIGCVMPAGGETKEAMAKRIRSLFGA